MALFLRVMDQVGMLACTFDERRGLPMAIYNVQTRGRVVEERDDFSTTLSLAVQNILEYYNYRKMPCAGNVEMRKAVYKRRSLA